MNNKELHRLEIIQKLHVQSDAAEQLGISIRQVRRLLRAFEQAGAKVSLPHRRRGCLSNRKLPQDYKAQAIEIIKDKYYDCGPTLATEKLAENHGLYISKETIRKIMIQEGLWETRSQRLKRAYQPRYRRECYGELIQIDGSEHYWLEKRGPKCTLLVYIDDATGKLMELQFVPQECTFSYFESIKRYLQRPCSVLFNFSIRML